MIRRKMGHFSNSLAQNERPALHPRSCLMKSPDLPRNCSQQIAACE
jgi:hypothetical protein